MRKWETATRGTDREEDRTSLGEIVNKERCKVDSEAAQKDECEDAPPDFGMTQRSKERRRPHWGSRVSRFARQSAADPAIALVRTTAKQSGHGGG